MKKKRPFTSEALQSSNEQADFSLVLGGPFYSLMRKLMLSDESLLLVHRRVIALSLVAWLPLLLLTAYEGHLFAGSVAVPFMLDLEAHIRLLVALPLLIIAEPVVHHRMCHLVQQFTERKLIPENEMDNFRAAIDTTFKRRNSYITEILLVFFVYGIGVFVIWRNYMALNTATWYATETIDGSELTMAGTWYVYVALPMAQFLLCRWYFRIAIWANLLWKISRIPLRLVPTHPDRVGGLGFLPTAVNALVVIAIAHGALLAGQISNQIFFRGASLPSFNIEITAMVIFTQALILIPLTVFSPQLVEAKWTGVYDYGTLYSRFMRELDTRWVRHNRPVNDELDGSQEMQSLADLEGGYQIVQSMRVAPFTLGTPLMLAAATLIPIAPLVLTMMPMEELVNKLIFTLF